jgi:CubicO group peptidase (beta-lactamase class C family)
VDLERLGSRGHRALAAGVIRGGERECRTWSADGPQPDESALFEIGSVTKAFTGVLLADMSLRGEVALDDPLSRHFDGPRPAWRSREPTLLELATHRTGLPNTPGRLGRRELAYALGLRSRDPWADVTSDDYAQLVARESPRRAPGGRVKYSSVAFGLLGDALAARAAKPYEDLLRERVLEPLGMTRTAITTSRESLMQGHSRRGRPRPPIEDFMPAAGSVRSNVGEMLRFLGACLDPPNGAFELAQQPQARISKRLEIGLAWLILSRPRKPKVVWHNGGTWGFRSFAAFAPERGAAAVILSNTARSVDRFGLRLVDGDQ